MDNAASPEFNSVPLLGLAAYLLVKDVRNIAASVSRIALGIYVPIYAAFDALAGIGTGILVQFLHRNSLGPRRF